MTREYLVIIMWAGQLFGEGLNYLIKHIIKQDRPHRKCLMILLLTAWAHLRLVLERVGSGYGFPSSHSQYMGYFATFLICHIYCRHRFASTGWKLIDQLWRLVVYAGLLGWAGAVAYSR
jgi:dolichyldiphosphatase